MYTTILKYKDVNTEGRKGMSELMFSHLLLILIYPKRVKMEAFKLQVPKTFLLFRTHKIHEII